MIKTFYDPRKVCRTEVYDDYEIHFETDITELKGIIICKTKTDMFIYVFKNQPQNKYLIPIEGYYIIPKHWNIFEKDIEKANRIYLYRPFKLKGFWHGIKEILKRK